MTGRVRELINVTIIIGHHDEPVALATQTAGELKVEERKSTTVIIGELWWLGPFIYSANRVASLVIV